MIIAVVIHPLYVCADCIILILKTVQMDNILSAVKGLMPWVMVIVICYQTMYYMNGIIQYILNLFDSLTE